MKAISSNIVALSCLAAAIASNTATKGTAVDTASLGNSVSFFSRVRLYTDGTYVLSAEESDDNVTFTAVAAEKIVGSSSQAALSGANPLGKIGVFSSKRYVKPVLTSTGVTIGATIDVIAIGESEYQPV